VRLFFFVLLTLASGRRMLQGCLVVLSTGIVSPFPGPVSLAVL